MDEWSQNFHEVKLQEALMEKIQRGIVRDGREMRIGNCPSLSPEFLTNKVDVVV